MTAEWHLPSREPDEDDTSATKKLLGMSKERLLLPGSDMLNDIVHQYDIVTSRLVCRNGCFQKVFGYKSSCSPTCFKEGTCLLDSPVTDVDTRHIASYLGKGQKISALATAYFQYSGFRSNGYERTQEIQIKRAGGIRQFLKILAAVRMSLLHKTVRFFGTACQDQQLS